MEDGPVRVFDEFEISADEVCAIHILGALAATGTIGKRVIRLYRCVDDKRQADLVVERINSLLGMKTYGNLAEWWTFGVHEGQIEAIPRGYTQEQVEADRARYTISK